MQAYLINLARRADRLHNMTAQFSELSIPFQLVAAVDAKNMPNAVADRHFAADGPLGPIPKGDKCCSLSHMRAWSMFLSTGDSHGLVLEDDVAIDPDAALMLHNTAWLPASVGLLKIERFGPEGQRVLLDDLIDAGHGRQIGRMRSRHTGAAAYILSRETAQQLLTWSERWPLPVDHLLFNPNNSPLAEVLRPYQLTPAVAQQSQAIGGRTDIDEWRAGLRDFSWRFIRRELVRSYYELRLLPSQAISLLKREAELVRVGATGNLYG